ncbi:methyltransferase domain-containing protein [Nocardiopsis sp. CC223A]|uniref:methyltransferase domain-containing protein n=1 Tax=Nocardiopsis sp. CC223A TaxID=3044051 RepID=UPI00278C4975|nr:methyltransferase domain-containing protein [Nocardiopsis sp. CC223A]
MSGKTEDMTRDHRPLARALAADLQAEGVPGRIADLFTSVPRHLFLPDVYWTIDGTRYDRGADPDGWLRTAYSDQALTTQYDDGAEGTGTMGIPTSSSSAPAIMARMLAAAELGSGHRVLEVGTGTGYNAALLSELLGEGRVVTIEIDHRVAVKARTALAVAGYRPGLLTGDGENLSSSSGAGHDRIIATCTVAEIPLSWMEVLRPLGRIVTPWAPSPGLPGGLLAVLDDEGERLSGRFEGALAFMWARGQRGPARAPSGPGAVVGAVEQVDGDPRKSWFDGEMSVLLSLLVPDWFFGLRMEPGAVEPYVWVASTRCASWLHLHADGRVEEGGSRRMFAEFTAGLARWRDEGSPGIGAFGLSVDRATGDRTVWLRAPEYPLWTSDGNPI